MKVSRRKAYLLEDFESEHWSSNSCYCEKKKCSKTTVLFSSLCIILVLFLLYIPMAFQLDQQSLREEELEGWPKNGSRDATLFIQPGNSTALLSPEPEICKNENIYLLVVVCSAVNNIEARNAIRETWGNISAATKKSVDSFSSQLKTTRVVFLLGYSENTTLQANVLSESKVHNDVVQEGFLDTYNNLTLKSLMLLKWVKQHCSNAQYIMKTDDDSMINLKALQSYLHQISRHRSKQGLLAGALICGARPILDSTHKWYMPHYLYSDRTYPNYLSGSGYVMSQEVLGKLYESSLSTPLLPLEDVYITGQCASRAGVRPMGYAGFNLGKRTMTPCVLGNPQIITTHRLNPNELREAWSLAHAPQTDCNRSASTSPSISSFSGMIRGAAFSRKQRNSFSLRRNPNSLGCF